MSYEVTLAPEAKRDLREIFSQCRMQTISWGDWNGISSI